VLMGMKSVSAIVCASLHLRAPWPRWRRPLWTRLKWGVRGGAGRAHGNDSQRGQAGDTCVRCGGLGPLDACCPHPSRQGTPPRRAHTIPSVLCTSMPWGRGLRKIKSAMKTYGIGDCGGGAKRWLIRCMPSSSLLLPRSPRPCSNSCVPQARRPLVSLFSSSSWGENEYLLMRTYSTLSSVPSLFSRPCCWVPTIKKPKQIAGAASLAPSPIPAPPRGCGRLPRPDSSTMHGRSHRFLPPIHKYPI
jgi:hypothetical protein